MHPRITEGIVTSTTFLFAVLLTIMLAGAGRGPQPPQAISGTPTYADPLNDPTSANTQGAQWDGVDGNNGNCIFGSDGYHVKQNVATNNLHACYESVYQYGNATVVVDVTILKGHSGGLFLRFTNGTFGIYTGYLFEIDSRGRYKFSIFPGSTVQDWTASPALKTGYNVTNTIAVIMNGDSFALYANGSYLATMTGLVQSTSGNLALFASAVNIDTKVLFSNLEVYQMS